MSEIQRHSGENYGGNYKIYYALRSEATGQIDFLEDPVQISQALIDNYFYEIKVPRESVRFAEPDQLDDHGLSYTPTITFRIHKDRQEIRDQLKKVGVKGLWILLIDNNGQATIIGDEENVLYQRVGKDSGTQVPQPNHFQYTISAVTSERSRLVDLV